VGAALEGAPSCNGWTYWQFRRDGKTVPIDFLRQQIRAEMGSAHATERRFLAPRRDPPRGPGLGRVARLPGWSA
jgi:hypothetical protein